MSEENDLLNRLGEMEEAPLIWVNKKVYDMAEEIERLKRLVNKDYTELNILELKNFDYKQRISKAIEYIEENKKTHECNEYCFDNMLEDVIPLLEILKGVDKE